jgi:tRNA(Arg) A34 adenosine deaminase TadA
MALPQWLPAFVSRWSGDLQSIEDRMSLAIALSRENVDQTGGGPFGAVVYDLDLRQLLGAGVNLVTMHNLSCAHAEIVAISLAQQARGDWNLGSGGKVELVTSCEPCAMCFGAVPWSGVKRLVCGARKEDAESAGFDEGDKPEEWSKALARRGIEVFCDVLRDEAAEVFAHYKKHSGTIYNP